MKGKHIFLIILISAVSAIASVWVYDKLFNKQSVIVGSSEKGIPANYAGFFDGKLAAAGETVDLTNAASTAVPAVVC